LEEAKEKLAISIPRGFPKEKEACILQMLETALALKSEARKLRLLNLDGAKLR
jgi:hypothetical protein